MQNSSRSQRVARMKLRYGANAVNWNRTRKANSNAKIAKEQKLNQTVASLRQAINDKELGSIRTIIENITLTEEIIMSKYGSPPDKGRTLLHDAAASGSYSILSEFLNNRTCTNAFLCRAPKKINVNVYDATDSTPLMLARRNDDTENNRMLIQLLIDKGAVEIPSYNLPPRNVPPPLTPEDLNDMAMTKQTVRAMTRPWERNLAVSNAIRRETTQPPAKSSVLPMDNPNSFRSQSLTNSPVPPMDIPNSFRSQSPTNIPVPDENNSIAAALGRKVGGSLRKKKTARRNKGRRNVSRHRRS
jgi:hypothetical protein